ncbi:MAG: B12-binding domain-containing radical SAM protein, partial [Candidatus Helarchaeota archaeon]
MRVVLIFPNINLRKILKISSHPPLGLAYLAAALENAAHEVVVIDANALNLSYTEIMRKITEISPDVIGITTNILSANQSLILCKLIRQQSPTIKLVLGGPWACATYEMLLQKEFCDYVVVGEGEIAFIELLTCIEKNLTPAGIPGVALLADGTIKLEPPKFIEDLDALPFPAWHLFPPPKAYLFHARRKTFYPIMTSRGCPYQCNHCTKLVHGFRMRYRSVENVIAEIRYLKEKFSVGEIMIVDDNFTIN